MNMHRVTIVVFVALCLIVATLGAPLSVSLGDQGTGSPDPQVGLPIEGRRVTLTLPGSRAASLSTATVPATMSEGFEGTWPAPGWSLTDQSDADGGEYLFGKRDCHPRTGSYGGWCVGGGTQGSGLSCSANYPNNILTWATYGPFDLSTATAANLDFHMWGQCEYGQACDYDYLFVGGSTDGIDFSGSTYCGDWTIGDEGEGYFKHTIDLSEHLGQSQVWIAFVFVSDYADAFGGLIVDDVSLNVRLPPQGDYWLYLPLALR